MSIRPSIVARVARVARAAARVEACGTARLVLAAAAALLAAASSCSLLLTGDSVQCHRDRDCARFPGAVCDQAHGICVDGSVARACRFVDGCLACRPGTAAGFLNACTDTTCVPFDNRARLTHLAGDGTLTPLP